MANTLYEYYKSLGQALPSVQDRTKVASEAGISGYAGTAEQNTKLLQYLQTPKTPSTPQPAPVTPAPNVAGTTPQNTVIAPPPAPAGPTATPAGIGLTFTPDPNQAAIDAAIAATTSQYSEGVPDEAKIRANTLAGFQTEIDALDRAAAEARARVTAQYTDIGNRRVGSQRALLANSGMIGQVSGEAQKSQLETANAQELDAAVAAEQAKYDSQKSALLGQARSMAQESYQAKLKAYSEGAAATVQYMRDRQATASANATKLARQALAAGIDLTDPEKRNDVNQLAKQIGIAPEDFILTFQDLKKAQDDAKAAALKEEQRYQNQLSLDRGKLQVDQTAQDIARQRLGFDMSSFEKTYALDAAKAQAEIDKIYNDIANGGANEVLTPEQAEKYGVPYGTTKSQFAGVIPGQAEKIQQIDTQLTQATAVRDLIQTLINHPGRKGATGANRLLTALPGSDARDFTAKFDQLKAILSLDNISKLKGTGAISDKEGELLANAASALRRDTSEGAFLAELQRLEGVANTSVTKLQNLKESNDTNSLFNQFEGGGSEGTNPKAPSVRPGQASPLSVKAGAVNTKTLASLVLPKYPEGSKGDQCVTFLHKLAVFPPIGDGKLQKYAFVDKYGIPKNQVAQNAKVGMILISNDNKTYGHAAMINAISADGKYARLTESNYKGHEIVSHDRVVALNDPRIYGAIEPTKLKTQIA